jgi:hypothetical protein
VILCAIGKSSPSHFDVLTQTQIFRLTVDGERGRGRGGEGKVNEVDRESDRPDVGHVSCQWLEDAFDRWI